jgi:hypothetical protein
MPHRYNVLKKKSCYNEASEVDFRTIALKS